MLWSWPVIFSFSERLFWMYDTQAVDSEGISVASTANATSLLLIRSRRSARRYFPMIASQDRNRTSVLGHRKIHFSRYRASGQALGPGPPEGRPRLANDYWVG